MPRGPRLDAPGVLHHVMMRGIERRALFRDDRDRRDFVARLEEVVARTGLAVLAWALLPNHVHLLVQSPQAPGGPNRPGLSAAMRSLLTGYAGAFNRRHHRTGHLFQNRYKSVVVEAERYLLEVARYIHLNPLRARLVRDLAALDRFPWAGHSALMGRVPRPWQAVDAVLGQFHRPAGHARQRYRQFVAEGVAHGRRPDLQGGGLRRSAGGWERVATLRRGRERWAADERVLGSGPFVETLRQEVAAAAPPRTAARAALLTLVARCAAAWQLAGAELLSGSRRRAVAHARAVAACLAVRELGLPMAEVGRALGISPTVVRAGIARGETLLRGAGLTRSELVGKKQAR